MREGSSLLGSSVANLTRQPVARTRALEVPPRSRMHRVLPRGHGDHRSHPSSCVRQSRSCGDRVDPRDMANQEPDIVQRQRLARSRSVNRRPFSCRVIPRRRVGRRLRKVSVARVDVRVAGSGAPAELAAVQAVEVVLGLAERCLCLSISLWVCASVVVPAVRWRGRWSVPPSVCSWRGRRCRRSVCVRLVCVGRWCGGWSCFGWSDVGEQGAEAARVELALQPAGE